jgi:hypothetical protein
MTKPMRWGFSAPTFKRHMDLIVGTDFEGVAEREPVEADPDVEVVGVLVVGVRGLMKLTDGVGLKFAPSCGMPPMIVAGTIWVFSKGRACAPRTARCG